MGGHAGGRKFFAECLAELIAFAEWEARLNERDDKGIPARKHLESLATRDSAGGRKAAAELEGPEFPEELRYLWEWSEELATGRQAGGGLGGPAPIGFADIQAWGDLFDRHPAPHETQALLILDRARLFPRKPEPDEGEAQPVA
jgi:hypothetical protein